MLLVYVGSLIPRAACGQERKGGRSEEKHLFLFWFLLREEANTVQCN